MATVIINTPFNIDLEFRTAGITRRFLAWLIDMLAIVAYYFIILRFVYPLMGMSETVRSATELIIVIIPVLLYQLAFELFFNGQTLGKMATGIKVIDKEGKEPTWGQYLLRWILSLGNLFVYAVPYIIFTIPIAMLGFMIVYIPDFICMIISSRSQRIGDLAAGTVVIDKQYASSIDETIYLHIQDTNYVPVFPQVMRLTDRDINGIRNLLHSRRGGRDADTYMQQVAQKIKRVLSIESDMEPAGLLEQLLQDYNYYTSRTV